jgi:peptide/nickel transport system ATP-binding protein
VNGQAPPTPAPLVEVADLRVVVRTASGDETAIVEDVGFRIATGEVLALIGESGSGKTTIALTLLGHARRGCRIAGGSVRVAGIDVLALDAAGRAAIRGRRIAYVAQSAAASFNPAHTLMDQVVESALLHGLADRATAERKAVELFRSLALPDPEHIGARYPHQVSGGQLQRVMAAMALITDPALVIFDEPTTALDVTTQIEVLRAFKTAVRERNATAVYVSHDLAVVAQMADRIVVLNRGRIREIGGTVQVLDAPADDYTRTLMAASRPAPRVRADAPRTAPVLSVRDVAAGYGPAGADGLPRHVVLRDVSFDLARGATLGVIGESGSGKSTLARVIAGLVPAARGEVRLDGQVLPPALAGRTREQFRRVQIVFQDADTALNPAHTVERILARPLELYHGVRGDEARRRIAKLMDLVHLPAALAAREPRELSGGQKQRVNLARALAAEPDVVLCDEVTSALDTVVAAAVLDLLAELRRELGLSLVFISHDIATVRSICDDVLVLYAGRTAERGTRAALAAAPFHPYTDLLIGSVPEPRPGWLESVGATTALPPIGAVPDGAARAALCPFLARCPQRVAGLCDTLPPPRLAVAGTALVGASPSVASETDPVKEIVCHRTPAQLALAASRVARTSSPT